MACDCLWITLFGSVIIVARWPLLSSCRRRRRQAKAPLSNTELFAPDWCERVFLTLEYGGRGFLADQAWQMDLAKESAQRARVQKDCGAW